MGTSKNPCPTSAGFGSLGLTGGSDAAGRIVRISDHLKRLSAHGDPLEELGRVIDFEAFRPVLVVALVAAVDSRS
ncbi:hypothetical protein [Sphingobium sp. SA916]|uniref:hypothetical protein n=1 Tax=Sphingobium sp. SA916 TaxID=1851207 RepID=UPI000CAA71DF|nr:hypothetical protein [Sphingobium sp. SA916]PNQ03978.1 hypothetical protein A8G00_08805 [Sphingobium sp. SA916]